MAHGKKKEKLKKVSGGMMNYPMVHLPTHPRADFLGFVPRHVLIMETLLGRPLAEGELIHHLDWNKANNCEKGTNYLLTDRATHQRIPKLQARFLIEKGLLAEWVEWFKINKDNVDKIEELENEIVRLENEAKRKEVRYAKATRGRGGDTKQLNSACSCDVDEPTTTEDAARDIDNE